MGWKTLVMLDSLKLDGAEILVVSPTPTWPLDHGNRKRIFSVCNALKKRGAIIHFLHYPSEGDWRGKYPKRAMDVMQEQWDYCYKVTPSLHLHMSAKGDNHLIDEWWDEAIENELKWLNSVHKFDAIIVNYTWLSKALEFVPEECIKVLDTHDRFSNRGDLLQEHGIKKEFFHTTQHEETKALVRANIVWAIKQEEEEFFRALLKDYDYDEALREAKEDEVRALRAKGISVEDIEEKVEEKNYHIYKDTVVKTMLYVENKDGFTFQAPYINNKYLTIGMVGAYNNINLVNTRAFLEIALPIFEKYMVPVKILLAGSMCKGLQDIDHLFVEQLGRVESLDDFYSELDIALVPMTFSTGLKIKVGEALAYGIPIIAHKHAYEGYPVYHKWQELDSLEEITMAIVTAAHEYQEVEELRMASENAQLALHNEVSATLDYFVYAIKKHLPTALVMLPKLYSGDYSLEKLRLAQVVKTLDDKYRVILYYPYELTTDVQVFLEDQSSMHRVSCKDNTIDSKQIWTNVSLKTMHQTWQFELLWNLSDKSVEKSMFEKEFYYFDDNSLNDSTERTVDVDCDVLVQSVMAKRNDNKNYIDWYHSPLTGNIEDLYKGLWKKLPADESKAIYMMLSGTKEQIFFWHKVYSLMFEEKYKLYWIIDSEEVDWHIENRLDPVKISKNYLELGDAARCGIMVNIAKSNLLSTIAWTFFICKRRVYDVEEVGMEKGQLKLSLLYREMKRSVEELDLNNYNNRFQHNVYYIQDFKQISHQLQQKKVGLCLK